MFTPTSRAPRGFHGFEPWERRAVEVDEVYIWRAIFQHAPIHSRQDLQDIVRAVAQNQDWDLNYIKGIAVQPLNTAGDGWQVDVVFAAKNPDLCSMPTCIRIGSEAQELGDKVEAALRERFPNLSIVAATYQITDAEPKHPALDFWLAHSTIWDKNLGPMDAFGRFEGLYRGSAEDGRMLQPYQEPAPGLPGGPLVVGPRDPAQGCIIAAATRNYLVGADAACAGAGGAWCDQAKTLRQDYLEAAVECAFYRENVAAGDSKVSAGVLALASALLVGLSWYAR